MIPKTQRLDKEWIDRRMLVRSVFATGEGRKYLAMLIRRGMLFDQIRTEEECAVHNQLVRQLEEAGFADEEMVDAFVDWLFTQPVCYRDKETIGGNDAREE